jgi:hypothetical protein
VCRGQTCMEDALRCVPVLKILKDGNHLICKSPRGLKAFSPRGLYCESSGFSGISGGKNIDFIRDNIKRIGLCIYIF